MAATGYSYIYTARMKCHRCLHTFGLTSYQLVNDTTFPCPHCKGKNYGSTYIDDNGNLLGVKSARTFEKMYKEN